MELDIHFKMSKTLIIDCGSTKVEAIEKILLSLNVAYEIQKLNSLNSIDGFSAIIISGAPILLTEVDHVEYLKKAHLIFTDSTKPILGICFGHQLMGIYHKAIVTKCKDSRSWEEINFNQQFDLLPGINENISIFEDHCECITVPEEFLHIASSKTCYNEVMQHKTNVWYGVQFHPEVSGAVGHELIANFIGLAKEK